MKFKKAPKNFETVTADNIVIGYYDDYAIVQDEYHRLYYIEMSEHYLDIGTVISSDEIASIEFLDSRIQQEIMSEFSGFEEEM